jgi:hypothetical protein
MVLLAVILKGDRYMTGREKLIRALRHEEGPVPLDFGSTSVTGAHCSVIADLRRLYGLEQRPVKIIEPYQMLGELDEELRASMGIDTIGVSPSHTMFGFEMVEWKEWSTPWNQDVLVPKDFAVDEKNGGLVIYPQGDKSVPPSGIMLEGGYFFDSLIRQEPIEEDSLDPKDNLEEFNYISDHTIQHFVDQIGRLEHSGKAIVANFGGTGLGGIALVPGMGLKYPKGIRDVEEWYISIAMRPDYIHEVFSTQTEIALHNLQRIYEQIGNSVDVVFLCGTDFGTQESQFMSIDTFRSLYFPYYKKINDWIHKTTEWKTFKHSCGSIEPFLETFIESGFDIINPVQCSAALMEPSHLKTTYGQNIVFWGGGVDTQQVLPFGTPEEVREEVLSRLQVFSTHGGYVFNSVHNLQPETPIKNIEAMMMAFNDFNAGR